MLPETTSAKTADGGNGASRSVLPDGLRDQSYPIQTPKDGDQLSSADGCMPSGRFEVLLHEHTRRAPIRSP